jgi:hypothetical protein
MTTSPEFTLVPRPGASVLRAPVPPTRDPFINTPLIRVRADADGTEWFWISTWNAASGATAALVSETGAFRIYRFPPRHPGFYSAVAVDDDTLWLCGSLDRVVRLTVSTGDYQEYPTGAPAALVFQGMAYDPATGLLFAAAFPWGGPGTVGFAFDTHTHAARVFEDISPAHYMRHSFPNGDGTYSIVLDCPRSALLRWDPAAGTLADTGHGAAEFRTIADDRGRRYLPGQGWYDPQANAIQTDGPVPNEESSWFARREEIAYGATADDGATVIRAWDLASGTVTRVATIPDSHLLNANLTASGKLIAVNLYGVFYRYALDGTLEMSRVLPTDAIGAVDCVRRIDAHRLLGTPFITQRFWEVDLRTGAGYDCGRAAPGVGEVLRTWALGGKIYMAAYTGGELVKYDPAIHPHFPENPRVVADPPGGMRPVADATDGRCLYYACSAEYGLLGSTLARYDTVTGQAGYAVNPLPDQQIVSLAVDTATGMLLAATTNSADCYSCLPSRDQCVLAQFDPETLAVRASFDAPAGATRAHIAGPLGDGQWLVTLHPTEQWAILDSRAFTLGALRLLPDGAWGISAAGAPGRFLLRIADRLELWDAAADTRTLLATGDFHQAVVQDGSHYLFRTGEVVVVDGFVESI